MSDTAQQRHVITGPESARIWINGRPYLNFVGSSYLALQAAEELRAAGRRALALGHPWSQMRSAAYADADPVLDEFEAEAIQFFGEESAVFMPTGYFCGMAAVAGLRGQFDVVCLDELAHYSLYDAALLSGCAVHTFAHADATALRDRLCKAAAAGQRPLVLTDGVYATTGRLPPLADYAREVAAVDGLMFVDESHAYGVLGAHGRGAAEHCGVSQVLHGGSIGKGLCAQGGVLPCSSSLAKRIRTLPPLRGAGAGAPVSALVGAAALRLARLHPERRQHLHAINQRLKSELRNLGLEILSTPAPITAFRVGRNADMVALRTSLLADGVHVIVSNYIGAGPEGMIRCGTFADHTNSDIDMLISSLRRRL